MHTYCSTHYLLRQGDVAQAGLRHSMYVRMTLNPTPTVQGLQLGANMPDGSFYLIIMDFDTMPTLPGACHLFVSVSGQDHEQHHYTSAQVLELFLALQRKEIFVNVEFQCYKRQENFPKLLQDI